MSKLYYHEEMREWKTLENWKRDFEDFGETTVYKTFEEWKSNHLTGDEDYNDVKRI